MANQGVELATKQEESSRGRVNNLSLASHVLGVLCHKFNDAQLAEFRALCFGYLESADRLTFSGKKDFCLITGLRCDEPYDLEVEPSNIRLLTKYFPQKFVFVGESSKGKRKGKVVKGKGKMKTAPKKATKKVSVTCVELEMAFKQCEDEDDVLKMGLVYFAEGVLIEVKINVVGIREIVPTKVEKNLSYWIWGDDVDVVMWLWNVWPRRKIFFQRNVLNKVKELMEEVKAFRREVKVLALVGERIAHDHAEVQSFDDDDVAIYTHEGEHVGPKRKVRYTRAAAKIGATKRGPKKKTKVMRHMTLTFDVIKCEKL
ncbi:hypothetical protein DVH24_002268 [Malus domestica]|uniref:Uncharacterized protein n=1 Tax=Malus domestica TaxID=3750 RepID=A0A498I684_MALDO|nr:hypothetical protein DVH24_002268 [Malus domestica]